MPKSYNVIFASSNIHKYEEAKKILSEFGINLEFFQTDLIEIQSDSLSEIALKKVLDAYDKCKKPVIVEDDGLFINSLSGFPGPFSSYVFKTIGNNGILKLIGNNRTAQFRAVIAFCDSNMKPVFLNPMYLEKFQKIFKVRVGVLIQSLFQKNKTKLTQNWLKKTNSLIDINL